MATATIICLAVDLSFVLTTAFTIPKGFFKFIISLISSIRITCYIFLVVDITAYFFPIPLLNGFALSSYLDIPFLLRAFSHLAYSIHRCILTQAWPGLEKYNNLFCLMCYMALSHSPSNPTLMGKKHPTPLYPTPPTYMPARTSNASQFTCKVDVQ